MSNNKNLHKLELQKLINHENGINFHKNVNLSGWIYTKGESFISFSLMEINNREICVIDYIYITNKNALIQLMAQCINFWRGHNVKYIYYREHHRTSNVAEKILPTLGFSLNKRKDYVWKHDWTSTNGFAEEDVLEAFTD